MQVYLGYGFDMNDIADEDLVSFAEKYDAEEFKEFTDDFRKEYGESSQEEITNHILSFFEECADSPADYICKVINGCEKEKSGTEYLLEAFDDFIVFGSVGFADESARSRYIRTEEDFHKLIARYFPIEKISFGELYEGLEWTDPCYCFECKLPL